MEFAVVQDQDADLRPDINNLPDNFYVQDELEIKANEDEHHLSEELPRVSPRELAEL